MSACTLIMAYVPNDRLCFSESGSLVFHIYRESGPKGEPSVRLTQWAIDQHPQDIRNWIIAKGGVEKMTLQPWTLNAAELWAMGYRKCEPDDLGPIVRHRDKNGFGPLSEALDYAEPGGSGVSRTKNDSPNAQRLGRTRLRAFVPRAVKQASGSQSYPLARAAAYDRFNPGLKTAR